MQGFRLLLPAWMHGVETYNLHHEHNCKMKVYTGSYLTIR